MVMLVQHQVLKAKLLEALVNLQIDMVLLPYILKAFILMQYKMMLQHMSHHGMIWLVQKQIT